VLGQERATAICVAPVLADGLDRLSAWAGKRATAISALPLCLQMVWDRLNARFWRRNKDMAIRLATQVHGAIEDSY
jgi:hypothetical protein